MPSIGVLILAAGTSARMGQPKQLLPWKGTTLLNHTLKNAKAISPDVLVVLGASAERIAAQLPSDVPRVLNSKWQSGMGTSIAIGTAELESSISPEFILILVADQPLLDWAYFEEILRASKQQPTHIVATSYQGKAGVPALFPRHFFAALRQLGGDHGARHLMRENAEKIALVASEGKAIDLDTPENYQAYFKRYGQ